MENNSSSVLKRNSDFLALKQNGRRHWPANWMLLNFRGFPEGQVRFGVTASRKVGSAVVRNRLKRWCREYFRDLSKSERSFGVEINVIFKPIDQGFYKGLPHDEFLRALEKGIDHVRKILKGAGLFLVSSYRVIGTTHMGGCCRFEPSCSEYAAEALHSHHPIKAFGLIARRLWRCRPLGPFGFDPVPPRGEVNV